MLFICLSLCGHSHQHWLLPYDFNNFFLITFEWFETTRNRLLAVYQRNENHSGTELIPNIFLIIMMINVHIILYSFFFCLVLWHWWLLIYFTVFIFLHHYSFNRNNKKNNNKLKPMRRAYSFVNKIKSNFMNTKLY